MGKELERRNFLGKLTLGLSSLAVLPLFGWGKNTEKNMEEIRNCFEFIKTSSFTV